MFVHTSNKVETNTGGYLSHENIIELISDDIKNLKSIFKDLRENNDEFSNVNDLNIFKDVYDDLLKLQQSR